MRQEPRDEEQFQAVMHRDFRTRALSFQNDQLLAEKGIFEQEIAPRARQIQDGPSFCVFGDRARKFPEETPKTLGISFEKREKNQHNRRAIYNKQDAPRSYALTHNL
ncbi:MAG: hypothetical protein Fur0022_10090 [Anaerolineales bacterium]